MHLLTFDKDGRAAPAVRHGDNLVDLSIAAPDLAGDWPTIFAADLLPAVASAVAAAGDEAMIPAEDQRLLLPIAKPPKILCVGLNYPTHAEETGLGVPDTPVIFTRFCSTLVAHGEPLLHPGVSEQFDYEGELVAVIGRGGRHITKDRALDHVAGYSIFNDASVRDFQLKTSQWILGKNFDSTGAFGPEIVTADELPPGGKGLTLRTRLNGAVVQEGDTSDMMFDVAALIAVLSEVMTLEPGDLIVTGTPPGVGMARTPPLWMKPGDVCEIEIDGIGLLRNPVAAGPAS